MPDKSRVGLVLTPQARAMLRSDPLGELIRNDRFLDCDWVRLDDGYFVHARVAARIGEVDREMDIDLPKHFVLYLVSREIKKPLGFQKRPMPTLVDGAATGRPRTAASGGATSMRPDPNDSSGRHERNEPDDPYGPGDDRSD